MTFYKTICGFFYVVTLTCLLEAKSEYNIGVGIADITGPPVEVNFMGYASLSQTGEGLHLRLYSRAFVFEKDGSRMIFISADILGPGYAIKDEVIRQINNLYRPLFEYDKKNVILSASHNHGGTGGYLRDFMFDVSILGYNKDTFQDIVDGIARSIVQAHENIQPARLFLSQTRVDDVSVNRSPASYLANPQQERDNYDANVDKIMTQLKIVTPSTEDLVGVINWFAIHPVSMNMTNKLVTSDNIGYASVLIEKAINPYGTLPGKGKVVASVSASNLGDVTPNIMGPRCELTGERCDIESSKCPVGAGQCFAVGPGKDHFESTKIIAERIANAAVGMLSEMSTEIRGPIRSVHHFIDMPTESVPEFDPITRTFNESNKVSGCIAAMGYSFGAGTTDGPSDMNIEQGTTDGDVALDFISSFIAPATQQDKICHAPKAILLATGRTTFPYAWQPRVISTQLATIGNLVIAAIPGEFTTMSGRRLRGVVETTFRENGQGDVKVVAAGVSNTYIHYITTKEEYQIQRYEGASTIFGPNTLNIFLYKYKELAQALVTGNAVAEGPSPPPYSYFLLSFVPDVVFDSSPIGNNFGDVQRQPKQTNSPGDIVSATFVSGNPRNNRQHEASYATVEQLTEDADSEWRVIATDASWETKYIWRRESTLLGRSTAEIQWEVPLDAEAGTYRLHHYGHQKNILGRITAYEGITNTFQIVL